MGEYTWKHFNNIGIVTTKLSYEDLQPIKDEIKEIQNNFSKYNKNNKGLGFHLQTHAAVFCLAKQIYKLNWKRSTIYFFFNHSYTLLCIIKISDR
jgi:hypothetical protein